MSLKRQLLSAKTIAAIERLARSDPRLAATVDQWDRDPWLLNTPAGTIELQTGHMREHRREDYITKLGGSPIDRERPIPLWTQFLARVTVGDDKLQAYLKRVAGYCLTGITQEHVLFFFYGTGANGKGVFLNTLRAIWGDYAAVAPVEMFCETRNERHLPSSPSCAASASSSPRKPSATSAGPKANSRRSPAAIRSPPATCARTSSPSPLSSS